MLLEGTVIGGQIVLDNPSSLPEGARVEIVVNKPSFDRLAHYQAIIGCLDGLPADAAMNHDHYLYGSPKQCPGGDAR